jgi:hypothetical protein
MKLAFMSFLVASTSALVHAEALLSNVIVLSVLTALARSVEGDLRQDTSPTLDEQPLIEAMTLSLKSTMGDSLMPLCKINVRMVCHKIAPKIIQIK